MSQSNAQVSFETGFHWSDAWVLASVAVGGGLEGARLKDLLAASEIINRATLDAAELRGGLGKLIYRGFVLRKGERFVIAGGARLAVERLLAEQRPAFGVMQFFEELLNVEPYSIDNPQVDGSWPVEGITDDEVRAATLAYREELHSIWRELRSIDRAPLPERALHLLAMSGKGEPA